ncbi:MAG TPA: hypothetical protein VLJ83_02130 [Gemmatimonadaceae bacterium]|nr:hypothetical protein [Gemmatimonadaceae bacterium]
MSKSDAFFSPDQYATVAERIELFYSRFPEGRINTELVAREGGEITFKALVYRSAAESFVAATGWASEREGDGDVNTVACLENTETSAVGRALANLGFTASSKRPSREEIEKVARVRRTLSLRATRGDNVNLHSLTNVTADLMELLARAELQGFPARRAEVLRQRISQPGLSAARVRKIETALRAWVRRREL